MRRSGFTLVELVFVIVIIGILAAVAIPRFKNLRANTYAANVANTIGDVSGSGGTSSYQNAVSLNNLNPEDLNWTELYAFRGKDWSVDADDPTLAYYRKGKTDFNATLYYEDGNVSAFIACDDTKAAGKAFKEALNRRGLVCSTTANSLETKNGTTVNPTGTKYVFSLETQEDRGF